MVITYTYNLKPEEITRSFCQTACMSQAITFKHDTVLISIIWFGLTV